MPKPTTTIANWGNFPIAEAVVNAEDAYPKIAQMVRQSEHIIARGNGRCYGDAALGKEVFSTKRLNKFIHFDAQTGVLTCESGVLLSQVLAFAVPRGYFLYVTPGTKFVSVGGAIASDVHGKNHHKEGCFSDYVQAFDLMIENGDILHCSATENSDKYWASFGGMGLTGIILNAKFKLKKIETSYIKQESIKAENLDEIFRLFEESEDWTYTVAWIDCLQTGKDIGRSIMIRGEHALLSELPENLKPNPLKMIKEGGPTVPFFFPNFALGKLSIKLFNWVFYHKQRSKHKSQIGHYEPFFYPLDAVQDWNKIYGKNGFIQYQMLIPKAAGKEGMRAILECIGRSGQGSFLAVLKLFGHNNPQAYNAFPQEAYTLALDFKYHPKLRLLVARLDDLVEQYGGRIYRTKDAMSKNTITDYLQNTQSAKFQSQQSQRIHPL
jgi:decaprenylphospho-beta-D-ribofuranose 2-oxidase